MDFLYNTSGMPTLDYAPRRTRFTLRLWHIVVGITVLVLLAAVMIPTGVVRLPKRTVIEKLNTPVPVSQWTENGVSLMDGRKIPWREINCVDLASPVLSELSQNGLEMTDGRIYGLVKVNHWCGNDSVGVHWARVDVERLLFYRKEAATSNPAWSHVSARFDIRLSGFNWDPGDHSNFRGWCELVDSEEETRAEGNKPL